MTAFDTLIVMLVRIDISILGHMRMSTPHFSNIRLCHKDTFSIYFPRNRCRKSAGLTPCMRPLYIVLLII